MADRGGLQLLPETRKRIEVRVPGENKFLIWGILALVAVVGGFFALNAYALSLEGQLEVLDGRLVTLDKERGKDAKAAEELRNFSRQSALISTLLNNHIFWSKALAKLQAASQQQVRIKNFVASAPKKELLMSGTTTSYTLVARQIASFLADDAIRDVDLNQVKSSNLGGVEFTFIVQFDGSKFLQK